MALSGDVTTFDLQFGAYTDAVGLAALVAAGGKLFAVDPSSNKKLRLTHITSGQVIVPDPVDVTIGEDGTGVVTGIPHTGQATISPAGYAWRVEWNIASNKPSPGNLTFVVPSGAVADFDLLVPAATVPAVAISQPTVASVNGQTGAVSLDAADVGAATPGDLTAGLTAKQDAATLAADTAAHVADGSALDVALRAAFGAADEVSRFGNGVLRGLVPVGDGCGTFAPSNKSNGTDTFGYTRSVHRVLVPSQDFRLVYVNFQHGEPGDNPITVSARVEPISTSASPANPTLLHRVTFNGQESVTIAPMGLAISDPIALSVQTATSYLTVRTQVTVASGEKWPLGRVLNPAVTGPEGRVTGVAATPGYMATINPTAVPAIFANAYVPYAILGAPQYVNGSPVSPRTILGAGDSILHGLGALPIAGWFGQAMRELSGWTYLAACATGEITPMFFQPNPRAQLLSSRWSYVLHEYGNNECAVLDLAGTKANIIAGWREEMIRGQRVIAMTISPRTTSTDGWRTTANQTVDATHNGVRVPYNAWLRDGAPLSPTTLAAAAIGATGANVVRIGQGGHPVVALFDFADAVESARDSGLWVPQQGRSFTVTTSTNGGVVTSSDAAFTSADLNEAIWVDNAGSAGADYVGTITNIRSATQADVVTIVPAAVANSAGAIGVMTSDGIHLTDTSTRLAKQAFKTFLTGLPAST